MESRELTRTQVASIIEDFIDGRGGTWDWHDFLTATTFADESLTSIQSHCAGIPKEFPPENPQHYCNKEGLKILRQIVEKLKTEN